MRGGVDTTTRAKGGEFVRRVWIVVCLIVVIALAGPSGTAPLGRADAGALDDAVKIALWSAIATDRRQTDQWIDYTPASPLTLTWEIQPVGGSGGYSFACACIFEENPILAGQREKMHPYFDWWADAVLAAPIEHWSPAAKVGAAILAANWLWVTVRNNRSPLEQSGELEAAGATYTGPELARFAVLEYRRRF